MAKADKRARKRANQEQARLERETAAKRAARMRQFRFIGIGVVIVVIVVGIVALTGGDKKKKKVSVTPKATTTVPSTLAPPAVGPIVTMKTNYGTITMKLDAKNDPIGTQHFETLIKQKFYDGLTIHRAAKDFVIQGGDPQGDGSGAPKSTVKAEVPKDHYPVGSVAAAKTGDDPAGTFGNQFFIVTGSGGATLPNDYARFGAVISGLDVAEKIDALAPSSGDGPPTKPVKIESMTVADNGSAVTTTTS